MNYKENILSHIIDYLKTTKWEHKIVKDTITLICPFCKNPAQTARQIPHTYKISCINPQCNHKKKFSLLSFIRLTESDKFNWSEDQLLHHIKIKLGLEIKSPIDRENIEELFKKYKELKFSLLPVKRLDKEPIESEWQLKEHKDISEWMEYLKRDINIGLRTGISSGITVLDIDCLTKAEEYELLEIYNNKSKQKRKDEIKAKIKIPEDFKKIMGTTLIQKTWKGYHLIYKYDVDLRKAPIVVNGTKIDVENDGGFIVVCPSIINRYYKIKEPGAKKYNEEKHYVIKTQRKFINANPIIEMPKELKELILKNLAPIKEKKEDKIKLDIQSEHFKIDPKDFNLKNNGLEGICNDSFIRLGGVLRKELSAEKTEYVLKLLNNTLLEDPMEHKHITAIVNQLDKYDWHNEEKLANEILNYIKDSEEALKDDIERAIVGNRPKGEDKLKLDKCLSYLIRENYIKKRGRNYSPVKRLELHTSLIDEYKDIDFIVPYFNDAMYFAYGDMILIGGSSGTGKTHLAMNIVKRLTTQSIRPIYVTTEPGSRYKKITLQMGFKEGEYDWAKTKDPTDFEFEDNRVTIIDWLMPEHYKYTDKILKHFNDQLEKHGGLLFLFMQLRDDGNWFAKDLIKFYPAFATKFLYETEGDGSKSYFSLEKVRDSRQKFRKQKIIPTVFNWDTNELLRVDELKTTKVIVDSPIEEVNLGSGDEK